METQESRDKRFAAKVKEAAPDIASTLQQIFQLGSAAPICGQFFALAAALAGLVNVSPPLWNQVRAVRLTLFVIGYDEQR